MYTLEVKNAAPRMRHGTYEKLQQLRAAAGVFAKHGFYDDGVKSWLRGKRSQLKSRSRTYIIKTKRRGIEYSYSYESVRDLTGADRRLIIQRLRSVIRHKRQSASALPQTAVYRQIRISPDEYMDVSYNRRIDGVFTESGSMLQLQSRIRSQHVHLSKRPIDANEYIGIELEVFCPKATNAVIQAIADAGLHRHVNVGTDGSIRPLAGNAGYELRILAKRSEYARIVRRVCEVLKALKAKVNDSCGFHVHLDMRNRTPSRAFSNLVKAQDLLFSLVPQARRSNTYCQRVEDRSFDRTGSYDRYSAINDAAYARHKTLEIRLHSGTCNARKIVNWISLLLKIADAAAFETRVGSVVTLQRNGINIPKRQLAFLKARIEKFTDSFESESASEAAA